MSKLSVNNSLCDRCGKCAQSCPFSAVEINEKGIDFNAACKLCKICVKTCPKGAIRFEETVKKNVNKDMWKGVMVYVEHNCGDIHPVTIELVGKAKELAQKLHQPVYCVFIGGNEKSAKELLQYGCDTVYIYDHPELKHFRSDIYADVFEDCIKEVKPSIVLVGGTSVGRSLAPKLSTRFRTGLTADCTFLDVRENTDLIQVRPAFGGNIMAQIITPNTRPQFATVRYKVMDKAEKTDGSSGKIVMMDIPHGVQSKIQVVNVIKKETQPSICDADIIVAGGRGLKSKNDIAMLEQLAERLGGQTAFSRPLVEAGWANYTKQIGLSGRTVKPQLIITCGISGAIQFATCMKSSACIVAINKDKNAPIFKIAHYGIVGDIYEIVPAMLDKLNNGEAVL
ncbi:MAG: electron transfer flavoprotein subunit alpha [Bacillota bacterium]|nr:electron transfer flavoprotein subunit alpha [Bacillota bacterium]